MAHVSQQSIPPDVEIKPDPAVGGLGRVHMRVTQVDEYGAHGAINIQLGFSPAEADRYANLLLKAASEVRDRVALAVVPNLEDKPVLRDLVGGLPQWAREHPRLCDALTKVEGQPFDGSERLRAEVIGTLRYYDAEAAHGTVTPIRPEASDPED